MKNIILLVTDTFRYDNVAKMRSALADHRRAHAADEGLVACWTAD